MKKTKVGHRTSALKRGLTRASQTSPMPQQPGHWGPLYKSNKIRTMNVKQA